MQKRIVQIVQTRPEDVTALVANLRDADRAELEACGHTDIARVIQRSVDFSLLCWSGLVDDELACIFGVAPLSMVSGIGAPWMLGTPALDGASRVLVRMTPRYISRMLLAFPHLVNHVYAKNTTSVRWLKRLGFTLHEAKPLAATGEPFHEFEMRA